MPKRGRGDEWATITPSTQSKNTSNPIRKIVDQMKPDKPNVDKPFLALSIGDPCVDGNLLPPKNVEEVMIKNIKAHKHNGYPPSVGYPAARDAVAKHWVANFTSKNASAAKEITGEKVILASGASHSLLIAIGAVADPGDNILLPEPCFSLYSTILDNHGIKAKYYKCDPSKNWEADLEQMASLVNTKTKAILINNPSNPCGSNFTRKHVEDILAVAEEKKTMIISDEIYAGLVFKGEEFTSVSDVECDVPRIIIGGLAKKYVVPGWRMGWLLTVDPKNVLCDVWQGMVALTTLIVGPNSIAQSIIDEAVNNTPAEYINGLRDTLQANAEVCYDTFKGVPGLNPTQPQGAMYLMVGLDFSKFTGFTNDVEFAKLLMEEENVMVLPGSIFRIPGFFRVVYTKPIEQIKEAAQRIQECCARHTKKE